MKEMRVIALLTLQEPQMIDCLVIQSLLTLSAG
jgi:hypothetical protein